MYSLKTLKFNSTLNFIVSAIFTVILITSGMNSWFAVLLGAAMAIGMELPKVGFMYEAAVNKDLNGWIRLVLGVLSLILVCFSIAASASYMVNQTNIKRNESIMQSDEYTHLKENREMLKSSLASNQALIKTISDSYDAQIKGLTETKNNYPSNYITKKENLQKDINKLESDKIKALADANLKIEESAMNIDKSASVSDIKLNAAGGFDGFMGSITNFLNSKRKEPITPDVVTMIFFISMYITYELLTVMLVVLYAIKTKKEKVLETSTPVITKTDNKVVEMKPQERERVIGFKNESIGVNKDNLKKYVDYMYNNVKPNNCSAGYVTIAKDIKIETEEARGIKSYLQQQGVLKVDGNRTKILKDKSAINL